MAEQPDFFDESGKKIKEYIDERAMLLKMQTVEKTSKLIAVLFTGLILALLAFFILFFLSIMLGYYFASLTNSLYAGFGIVAGLYLILFIVILLLRKNFIEKYIINTVIATFFDKTADDNDDNNA